MAVFAGAVCRCSLGATNYGSLPSRARLQRIGPPSRCRDRRCQWSPHVTALRAQSELPAEHGASAAGATQAGQTTVFSCLTGGGFRAFDNFSLLEPFCLHLHVALFFCFL